MLVFKYDSAGIPKSKIFSVAKRTVSELKRLNAVEDHGDGRSSVLLPVDDKIVSVVDAAVSLKKKLRPELLVVIGIGGANLGAIAVQEALLGKDWNLRNHPRVLYADTVDPDRIKLIVDEMQDVLRQGRQVLLNVVSKSGATTETIANFEVLLNVLRRHRKDAERYVVVTTTKGSKLWEIGLAKGFSLLEIPGSIGGRYGVFSPIGLFPLGMLGIDLKGLLAGAAWMREKCLSLNVRENPAAIGAALLYLNFKSGRNVHDTFLFGTDLESLGKWYRQLLAESVGKEFDLKGKKVNVGITPTVSIGSTDLHSVGQLYIGGPQDKFTNFVTAHFNSTINVPLYHEYDALVPDLQKKELNHIMHAIVQGVKAAYKRGKRPFTETRLEGKTPQAIGAFMQWKMIETMLLGSLFGVNPFDQPAVELYKRETRRILGRH